jgi:flagellar biosynthesis protein FlhA
LNIVGGIIIGVGQYDISFADASKMYTLLTVGDGLVTQIPALIVSTAAGIIITRGADDQSLGTQVTNQIKIHHRAIYSSSGILFVFALIPGLPKIPFLAMGGLLAYVGNRIEKSSKKEVETTIRQQQEDKKKRSENLEELLPLELNELEVGYAIVNLVDAEQNGIYWREITHLRKQFKLLIGSYYSFCKLRQSQLKPGGYVIKLKRYLLLRRTYS